MNVNWTTAACQRHSTSCPTTGVGRGGVGELDGCDEMLDGTYTENPRATIVFGGYREHDRAIDRPGSLTTHG